MKPVIVLFFIFFCVTSQAETKPLALNDTPDTVENTYQSNLQLESSSIKNNLLRLPSLEFGLEYPMNFGVQLKYHFHDVSYARFGFGFMSGIFLESFERLSSSLGYLTKHETNLLSDTFRNSMYLDFRVGWIPYFREMKGGPYIELGLSNTLLGKGEIRGGHLSRSLSEGSFDELETYSAKTTAYNGTFHIGYSIPFEKLKFNLELGVIKILQASFMHLSEDQVPIGTKTLSKSQENLFQDFLQERGWIFPTVSAWISFSF